ncbi:MAG: methylmalonyl Co-A mutase-associated GTPase MeaB [Desulfobacterales bacterium]|nr:methylmalonyl Co-A mutase-associated GTPase MeaB [Desulfobacterales bacterium]
MTPDDPQTYIQGVLAGNRRALSKTITLVESSLDAHRQLARAVIHGLVPHTGKAVRLGITGVPGVGKSTFIESLGMLLLEKGHRIAVLAVDPSSVKSGGSILADKTRMKRLATETAAFIRPSPSRGALGGVAGKTRETMMVCEAAGFDVIIVETVGVGQSETAVSSMVDFFLVLLLAGAGDEIQGIKRGIMELADAVAITKSDGDNHEKALTAKTTYEAALHLLNPASDVWLPPVLICSAVEMMGIEDIWQTVLDHRQKLSSSSELEEKRKKQALFWMWSLVEEGIKERFNRHPDVRKLLPEVVRRVKYGEMTPTTAAYELLSCLDYMLERKFTYQSHSSNKKCKG